MEEKELDEGLLDDHSGGSVEHSQINAGEIDLLDPESIDEPKMLSSFSLYDDLEQGHPHRTANEGNRLPVDGTSPSPEYCPVPSFSQSPPVARAPRSKERKKRVHHITIPSLTEPAADPWGHSSIFK